MNLLPHIKIFLDLDRTTFNTDLENPPGEPHEDANVVIPKLKNTHQCELYLITKAKEALDRAVALQRLKVSLCEFNRCFTHVHIVYTLEHKRSVLKGYAERLSGPDIILMSVDDLISGMIEFGNECEMFTVQVLRGPHALETPQNKLQIPKAAVRNLYGLEEIVIQMRAMFAADGRVSW